MTTLISLPLYPFVVPQSATVAAAKVNVPMTINCREYLTDKNFGSPLPKGLVQGGFLPMQMNYHLHLVKEVLAEFNSSSGGKIRLGTPLEMLLYKKQDLPHSKRFVSIEKLHMHLGLYWSGVGQRFDITVPPDGEWPYDMEVFVVEDL